MISVQIQNILKNSIEENGQATLLVCGGSSPLKIFKELSESDILYLN
jgi:6-phosphogluconolactonase/glucosamine-6-phosphate isomerase/deaminase